MNTPRILITGAPGNVGTEVIKSLQDKKIPFRIGAYNPDKARQVFGSTCEITHFDFLNTETYAATFAGIEHMFLVRPPALANVQRDLAPAVQAAIQAGIKHIVFLSLQGVERNTVVPHYKIEQLIVASGVRYTFLRASFFMQNLSTTEAAQIRDHSEIVLPVGKAKTSFIDVRDIAAVAAHALTESETDNRIYTLTGREALTYDEIASKLSSVLGRTIRYTHPSVIQFICRQLSSGHQAGYTLIVAALYTITRFGNAKEVTHDVETVLGRLPISFDQFEQDYRECWQVRNSV